MRINKKIIFALALISSVISLLLIQETYAKYQTTATGNTDISIARWNINVNNQDITSNSSITNTITPIFSGNENIKDGVIAPQSQGYFDIVIDTSNVDVSFRYNISTNVASDSAVTDLSVTGYSLNGGEIIPVNGHLSDIGNTVIYNSGADTTINLRIYIAWLDTETETMNNASDTMATLSSGKAKLNVILSFIQVAN